MRQILGIDPGEKTGWCLYSPEERRVLTRGTFRRHFLTEAGDDGLDIDGWDCGELDVVIERPVAHGPTRPQVVECAYTAGRLFQAFTDRCKIAQVHELTRLEIKQVLTNATLGEQRVKDDASAWAALKLLHGDGCDKKGGAIHGVRSHERAALACAVAFGLRVERISFVHIDKPAASG